MKARAAFLIALGLTAVGAEGYRTFWRSNPASAEILPETLRKPIVAQTETTFRAGGRKVRTTIETAALPKVAPALPEPGPIPPQKGIATTPVINPAKACSADLVHPDRFAAMATITDANGARREVLNVGGDAQRHPASLTKMMTLLIAFSRIEAKKLKLTDRIAFSAFARSAPPSNMEDERSTLNRQIFSVEDVMMGIGVRSANDAARALAEKIAGSEAKFVVLMNAVARHIGMKNTNFTNASGLPDAAQVTTARDMLVLEQYMNFHYPAYTRFLSTKSFGMRGTGAKARSVVIASRNRLLHRTLDGGWKVKTAKTGFTIASGFNMVLEAERLRDGKAQILHLVVMGGRSLEDRNACIEAIALKL